MATSLLKGRRGETSEMLRTGPSQAIGAYLMVALALAAGIGGMGLIFDVSTGGSPAELAIGLPLLCAGLWWASREMRRSIAANRAHREDRHDSR